jgi:hypothetical protein
LPSVRATVRLGGKQPFMLPLSASQYGLAVRELVEAG